jgi:predicted nucleotidyltransferase
MQKRIEKVVSLIAKKFAPEKIILFGSCAKGKITQNSDIDILVIKKESAGSNRELAAKIHSSLWGQKVPVDIIVKSKHQFERDKKHFWSVSYAAANEGIILYG